MNASGNASEVGSWGSGDTRLLVTDMLCYGLGYDKFDDLTTEFAVRGEFADYGVRIDKQLVAFIEVKRAAFVERSCGSIF